MTTPSLRGDPRQLLACCVIGLMAAACGSSTPPSSTPARHAVGLASAFHSPTDSPFPRTVIDDTGAAVRVESADRIIPVDGDLAEIVFALGLGDSVVATDLSATYPAEADAKPEIGYQRALSAETIAAFGPTVVLATRRAGPPAALDDLRRLGFPVVIVPDDASPEGPGVKIRAVAEALGAVEAGERLAMSVENAIERATVDTDAGALPDAAPTVLTLYLRGAAAQLVLGAANATHWIIEAAGGVDAAGALGVEDSAPITAEAILAADPDVVLVTTAGLDTVGGIEGLLEIGALSQTSAGRNRRILDFDDQLLLGNGPRVAEVIAELAEQLEQIQEDR